MTTIDKYTLLYDACKRIKYQASLGIWNGKDPISDACRWLLERYPATLIFTRETGYHSSGWWKNPDYERCWHLSISFRGGNEKKALNEIIDNLFGEFKNLIWTEPTYSQQGKNMDVWHYRLFCDENWRPIQPRGEVYNTDFTELGWQSFSELQYENKKVSPVSSTECRCLYEVENQLPRTKLCIVPCRAKRQILRERKNK